MGRCRVVFVLLALLGLGLASESAAQFRTRNVLLLNSFERNFPPFSNYAEIVRTELGRRSPVPISFFEVSLQLALTPDEPREDETVRYLHSILLDQRLDLIVTIGGNAAELVQEHRDRLFPLTPVLNAALNTRRVPERRPGDRTTSVASLDDFPQMIDNILTVLPATERIFVVIGASAFEDYWTEQVEGEFERFKNRVTFEWSNHLPLDQILARVSSLPPHSAIFYGTLLVDASGVVQTDERVLEQLHAAAKSPLFGQYDIQVGYGIVGGSLTEVTEQAHSAVDVALRMLDGELPAPTGVARGRAIYDWRELQRWGINEASLPAGSLVQFRQPSAWDESRPYVLITGAVVVLESALIAGLVVQRSRRRRAEEALRRSYEQNQDLAGRLITGQEDERSRIARDLHDDVSQQLATAGIVLSGLKRKIHQAELASEVDQIVSTLQERNTALAESIRTISHELHPGVLQHAGLRATLQRHCADVGQHHRVAVALAATGDLETVRPEVALCLFRVAQEALTNAVRHGRARRIEVQLTAVDGTIELLVEDDGVGFVAAERSTEGLGLRSIDERVRQVGGSTELTSRIGHGTRLRVRVPDAMLAGAVAQA